MTSVEEEIERQERRFAAVHRRPAVRRAVAQLRVAADEGLGRETPQWIRDLAEAPLGSQDR